MEAEMRRIWLDKRTGKTNWHSPERCSKRDRRLTTLALLVIMFVWVENFAENVIWRIVNP